MHTVQRSDKAPRKQVRAALFLLSVPVALSLVPPIDVAIGRPAYAQTGGPRAVATPLEGTWVIVLSDAMKRSLAIMQLGLQQPPATEDDLVGAGLTAEERLQVAGIAQLLASHPESDEILKMKASILYMPEMRMVFSGDQRAAYMGPIQTYDDTIRMVLMDGARIVIEAMPNREAPFDGIWAPTREEYILIDRDTLLIIESASDRHITLRRATQGDPVQ